MRRLVFAPLLVAAVLLALMATAACDNGGESEAEIDALKAEAEALCPAEFVEVCIESYVARATGSRETALCVTPDGKWFMETPLGALGESCSDPDGVIVAIVGGE